MRAGSHTRTRLAAAPLPPRDNIRFAFNESLYNVANIKSQIKRNKTNEKARERNRIVKSELKTLVRATRRAIAAADKGAAETAFAKASKKLDKAVSKGVIHKNQAANRKGALAKQIHAL
ncbi:hypothetical protein GCM10010910_05210 [Microbacterium nanhaiense]|uniref:Small ribosomal subunit protein bS20 n=1 Tax=Microbacterium nanhaiense TaxID=1301026 RepID=A0ABQ2MXN3_9MICO|nr:hypothetical protein GCM10010910_05210 [Microbacterium nanhaiense]